MATINASTPAQVPPVPAQVPPVPAQVPVQVPAQVPAQVPNQVPPLPDHITLRNCFILPDGVNAVSGALEEISFVDDIDTNQRHKLYFNVTFDGELFRVKVNHYDRADGQRIVKFRCRTIHVNAEFKAFLERILIGRLRNYGIMRLDGTALPSWY